MPKAGVGFKPKGQSTSVAAANASPLLSNWRKKAPAQLLASSVKSGEQRTSCNPHKAQLTHNELPFRKGEIDYVKIIVATRGFHPRNVILNVINISNAGNRLLRQRTSVFDRQRF